MIYKVFLLKGYFYACYTRWHNILPYDSSRVVINNPESNGAVGATSNHGLRTDYINANHVRVPESGKHYILTQGPIDKEDQRAVSNNMMLMLGRPGGGGNARSETVPHFWTMAWQQKSPAIVMLCRTHERDAYGCLQCKCARYWPKSTAEEDIIKVADLEIRLLQEERLKASKSAVVTEAISHNSSGASNDSDITDASTNQSTIVRKIEVYQPSTNEKRCVTQYHYEKWPDFGVPEGTEVNNFLKLVNHVAEEYPSTEDVPNIVHCSAGVGRSGTFCLVDSCLERMAITGEPITQEQVVDTLLHMRSQRMGLIQTDDQLRFALTAISEGSEDILKTAKAVKKTKDLISSSSDVINVPVVCDSSSIQVRHVSPTCIKDAGDINIENGVIKSRPDRLDGKVSPNMVSPEAVRGITSNGKTRQKEGISTSSFARKR